MISHVTMLTIAPTMSALMTWESWRVGQPDDPGAGHMKHRAHKGTGGAPVIPRAA